MVPDAAKLKNLYEQTSGKDVSPSLSHSMFRRVLANAAQQEESFRRTQYWHGLYQYALLQAAQDVLQATQLLPHYSRGWARAGEILSELWKVSKAAFFFAPHGGCFGSDYSLPIHHIRLMLFSAFRECSVLSEGGTMRPFTSTNSQTCH